MAHYFQLITAYTHNFFSSSNEPLLSVHHCLLMFVCILQMAHNSQLITGYAAEFWNVPYLSTNYRLLIFFFELLIDIILLGYNSK